MGLCSTLKNKVKSIFKDSTEQGQVTSIKNQRSASNKNISNNNNAPIQVSKQVTVDEGIDFLANCCLIPSYNFASGFHYIGA